MRLRKITNSSGHNKKQLTIFDQQSKKEKENLNKSSKFKPRHNKLVNNNEILNDGSIKTKNIY